jgi:hypothetical protein
MRFENTGIDGREIWENSLEMKHVLRLDKDVFAGFQREAQQQVEAGGRVFIRCCGRNPCQSLRER